MTVPIDRLRPRAARCGCAAREFAGAAVRAQSRHLATVVTVTGVVDAVNADRISGYLKRFVRAGQPLVLDLAGVNWFARPGLCLLYDLDDECRAAGIEWALVAGPPVSQALDVFGDASAFVVVDSVPRALRCFAEAITARRRAVLPLLTRSA